MAEDDSSERARKQAKRNFKGLSMDDAESMKEYIARAKSLALNVQYHDIEVSEQEISHRVLNSLPPSYASEKKNFALRTGFSLAKLEGGLVRVETDGTNGSHARTAGFKARSGGQNGGRGGHNGGGRGKRDGKRSPVESAVAATSAAASARAARASAAATAVSAAAPARAARASAAISAAAAAISTTGAATAVPEVSAATSAAAARTKFRGMGSITRLFEVWSTRVFSVRMPCSTPHAFS